MAHAQKILVKEATTVENRRVSIIALVVAKRKGGSLLIDDGTGTLEARAFNENILSRVDVGSPAHLIGHTRIIEKEPCLIAEIAAPAASGWLQVRRFELGDETVEKLTEQPENTLAAVIDLIKRLDTGEGAPLEELTTQLPGAEAWVKHLMSEGEVYENRVGRVKLLE